MKKLAKELAHAHLSAATEKVKEFEEFRSEILDEAADLEERINQFTRKLEGNQYEQDSKCGLLPQDIGMYIRCFSSNQEKLEKLLDKDLQKWQE